MRVLKQNRSLIMVMLVVAVLSWHPIGLVAVAAESAPGDFPFQPGERLVYKLRWGIVTAGYAELEVMPFEQLNGERAWHFSLSIKTSKFMDVFYKVRDRIESYTDLALGSSMLYSKEQREGSTDRDVVVHFDRASGTAVYSNKGVALDAIEIEDGTLDPLASIYYLRKQAMAENADIIKPVTDGKKAVGGVARVVKRETLLIGGIEYDTFVVEPDLKDVRGVFEKSKKSKLRMWITADDRRLLVKVKSKVVVGSFTGTLLDVTAPL